MLKTLLNFALRKTVGTGLGEINRQLIFYNLFYKTTVKSRLRLPD
jgi:hypothetical protein